MYNRLIIAGSSASWKSHIATMLHENFKDKWILLPHRFVTRPTRKGSGQSRENTNVSEDKFLEQIKEWEIGPYWTRFTEIINNKPSRTELYGFESDEYISKITQKKIKLLVYSANNDCVRRMQDKEWKWNVSSYFEGSEILYVDCPKEDRYSRILERENNLIWTKKEATYRLADDGNDVKKRADYIVDNSITEQSNIKSKIQEIILGILNKY